MPPSARLFPPPTRIRKSGTGHSGNDPPPLSGATSSFEMTFPENVVPMKSSATSFRRDRKSPSCDDASHLATAAETSCSAGGVEGFWIVVCATAKRLSPEISTKEIKIRKVCSPFRAGILALDTEDGKKCRDLRRRLLLPIPVGKLLAEG